MPLLGTSFLSTLPLFIDVNECMYDQVYDLMIRIKKNTQEFGPVIKNTLQLNKYRSSITDDYVACIPLCTDGSDQGLNSFGGSS